MNINLTIGIDELNRLFTNSMKVQFSNGMRTLSINYAGNVERFNEVIGVNNLYESLQNDAREFLWAFDYFQYAHRELIDSTAEYLAKTFLIDTFPKSVQYYEIVRRLFGDIENPVKE